MVSQTDSQSDTIKRLQHSLVVSCQASEGEPLCAPSHICALALSAINGGASGLRLEGVENVRYVRPHTDLPIVGLTKATDVPETERLSAVYITPTFADANALAEAGADIIALDCTNRRRPDGSTMSEIIDRIHSELKKLVWADVSTYEEGIAAANAGADIISTTLSGYTEETASKDSGPDLTLLEKLIKSLSKPIVLEGKVWTPEEVTDAFNRGAHAVVVGSAITRPQLITRRFVDAIPAKLAT